MIVKDYAVLQYIYGEIPLALAVHCGIQGLSWARAPTPGHPSWAAELLLVELWQI